MEDMTQKDYRQSVSLCGCERSRCGEYWRHPVRFIWRNGRSFCNPFSINIGSEWQSYLFGEVGKLAESGITLPGVSGMEKIT